MLALKNFSLLIERQTQFKCFAVKQISKVKFRCTSFLVETNNRAKQVASNKLAFRSFTLESFHRPQFFLTSSHHTHFDAKLRNHQEQIKRGIFMRSGIHLMCKHTHTVNLHPSSHSGTVSSRGWFFC